MKKIIHILLISAFAMFLGACNQGSKSASGSSSVAVLDLAKVAIDTGHSEKIKQELNQVREKLKKDLYEIQKKLQAELKANQAKMGNTPTDQQRKEFGQLIADAQKRLKQAQAHAAMTMQRKKNEAVTKLRNDIRPIVDEIRKARGISIVLLKSNNVILTYSKDIDITEDVIAKIKKMSPAKPAADKQKQAEKKEDKK